jgi:hypothetical protein
MCRVLLSAMVLVAMLAVPATAAEPVYASYRGAWLGDPVSVVVAHFRMSLADVTIVQERPTLVQRLTWRPTRFVLDTKGAPESLDEMVFTFHLGRLVRIAVTYASDRTEGLTDADLREVFTRSYGIPALVPTRTVSASDIVGPSAAFDVVGQWGDADTLVLLSRPLYPRRVMLAVTRVAADRVMQAAITEGAHLVAQEAPARDLAQSMLDETPLRILTAKARRQNKAAFTP